jgi:predicted Zn-dependent peptidase
MVNGPTESDLKQALAAITRIVQKASDTIVDAFKEAQLDPEKAAQIKDIATRLQDIRDRNA